MKRFRNSGTESTEPSVWNRLNCRKSVFELVRSLVRRGCPSAVSFLRQRFKVNALNRLTRWNRRWCCDKPERAWLLDQQCHLDGRMVFEWFSREDRANQINNPWELNRSPSRNLPCSSLAISRGERSRDSGMRTRQSELKSLASRSV